MCGQFRGDSPKEIQPAAKFLANHMQESAWTHALPRNYLWLNLEHELNEAIRVYIDHLGMKPEEFSEIVRCIPQPEKE